MTKQDAHATGLWGRAYDKIPKSVFATVAWHLANLASDTADKPGAAEYRFVEELRALMQNEIIPARQGLAAAKAIAEDVQ